MGGRVMSLLPSHDDPDRYDQLIDDELTRSRADIIYEWEENYDIDEDTTRANFNIDRAAFIAKLDSELPS
tara:strand:+ start:575 stop:784 length:210 start_codon:yes stop_codon:yes gene_type:complete